MKNRYYVLLRNNKIYIRINKQKNTLEYSIKDIPTYPHVPFYVHLFNAKDALKSIRPLIKQNLYTLKEKLFKPEVFVITDDDTVGFEYTAIEDFIMVSFMPKSVFLALQYAFITPFNTTTYVCVSKSCRMFVLSYVKDRELSAQKFLPSYDYTIEELNEYIHNLHPDCKTGNVNIYLNGNDLSKYSSLGSIVDKYRLLDIAQDSIHDLKLSKIKA